MGVEHDSADRRLRRRPVPIYTTDDDGNGNHHLLLPDFPHHLRSTRSATNLSSATRHHPDLLQPEGSRSRHHQDLNAEPSLPVGFITEHDEAVVSPASSSLAPNPDQLRRVKSSSALATNTPVPAQESSSPSSTSKWKSAFDSAQYLAGGLISHPSTSTRHFSIIRHSHALICYCGPSTSISITILSDDPLPATRSLWLQQKGFSGNVGMTLKALAGPTGSWFDVTPARRAAAQDIPEVDKRGVQRDLKRFAKKASGRQKKHVPRETHVVRIPAVAADGYFRLVLCAGGDGDDDKAGKKVLCGSPVFRVASTSTDAGVLRGASLSTMPLEVGVKVASTIGQTVAKKYTGMVDAVVQSRANKLLTNTAVRRVGHAACHGYHTSGLGDAVSESWQRNTVAGRYDPLVAEAASDAPPRLIGPDSGPEAPFPITFDGKVVRGTGKSAADLGIPTANLSGVSETIKIRMGGVFAAWACVQPAKNAGQDYIISSDWHEAIVTVAPLRHTPPTVAMKNAVTVHIIHAPFHDTLFFDSRVKVLLMGHLHSAAGPTADPETIVEGHATDVVTTLVSLRREAWALQETMAKMKSSKGERSLSDRLDEAAGKVQQQVDRIPLHWAGVRSDSGAIQDKVYGNGGLWIPR